MLSLASLSSNNRRALAPTNEDARINFSISGVRVNCSALDDAVEKIMEEKRKKGNAAFSVCTLNMDHVVKLHTNDVFREAYKKARFVLADGYPIVLAGRIAGRQLERACGSDLIVPLCSKAAENGQSVFLLGSKLVVLQECAKVLMLMFPSLRISGLHAPSKSFSPFSVEGDEIISILRREQPDFCFLALGAPKQEIFAARCLDQVEGTAYICIGAGVDFLAGVQRRAAPFFRRNGLEWAWRLACEPSRLARRYLMCLFLLPVVFGEAAMARLRRST